MLTEPDILIRKLRALTNHHRLNPWFSWHDYGEIEIAALARTVARVFNGADRSGENINATEEKWGNGNEKDFCRNGRAGGAGDIYIVGAGGDLLCKIYLLRAIRQGVVVVSVREEAARHSRAAATRLASSLLIPFGSLLE